MADVNKTVGIIFQATDNASAATAGLAASLDKVDSAAKRTAAQTAESAAAEAKWSTSAVKAQVDAEALARSQGKLADETEKAGNSTNAAGAGIANLSRLFQILATSIVVKEFIDANVAVERFTLGMTQVVGSTQGAAREFEYVRGVANRLGIDVGAAADGFLTFSAATKGSALEGQATKTIFEAVAGTMASLGRSSADTQGALVQLAQGISKGKFELEDLKSIAERMPGFFQNFAESLGKTTPELLSLISAGKIT